MSAAHEEHIGYLTIARRAEYYSGALQKLVCPGDVVADLGCGVGVLGIQALQAGAARVYGIDHSDALELARETVQRQGLQDRYTCLRESTFRTVLPERVDLIICDHIGYFGIDYGIVDMMEDARRRFLKPGGRILPQRIRLMIAGAESEQGRKRAQAWGQPPVPAEFHWLHEHGLNLKHALDFPAGEICTAAQQLGEVDLRVDSPAMFAFTAELKATRDATFDGLAGWFDCELAEGVWMTNSPVEERGIDRANVFLACREPFLVKAGDVVQVSVKVRHDVQTISWTIRPPGGAPEQKLSTWKSEIIAPVDLMPRLEGPLALNARGRANLAILALVDGQRNGLEIEEEVLRQHPDLFPTETETRRYVRRLLGADAEL